MREKILSFIEDYKKELIIVASCGLSAYIGYCHGKEAGADEMKDLVRSSVDLSKYMCERY